MDLNHSKDRVEAFSDAVFAFAATLLVVSFEVPDTLEGLKDVLGGFVSFGLSFLALTLIWKLHYNFFRRITLVNNVLIFLNMALLFVILFYVYPMKFLANAMTGKSKLTSFEELAQLFSIYSVGFILVFAVFTIMYRYASKIHEEKPKLRLKFWSNHFLIFVLVGTFAMILSVAGVGLKFGIPGFAYALLGPLCYIHGQKFQKNLE